MPSKQSLKVVADVGNLRGSYRTSVEHCAGGHEKCCSNYRPFVGYGRSVHLNRILAVVLFSLVVLATACTSGSAVSSGAETSGGDTGGSDSMPLEDSSGQESVAPTTVAATTSSSTTSTSTTTTSAPTTTTTLPPPTPEECANEIPIDVRVGQLLFPVVTQAELGRASELAAKGYLAGVVVLGSPNSAITNDFAALQAASLIGPSIVSVDEEGGRVQRVAALAGRMPSARTQAANGTPGEVEVLVRDHAHELGALGFTMNLAPVLDLDTGVFIGDRSFSQDPNEVSSYGLATVRGIQAAGLDAVAKHFPGHGRGSDSHVGLPVLPPLEELRESDLLPFVDFIEQGGESIMIGHVVVPGTTGDLPASLSPAIITDLLRDELGFDGVVMTDAFNMDAIAQDFGNDEAAVAAIGAGADLAMLGNLADTESTIARLISAVSDGEIPEDQLNRSFHRILALKGLNVCELPAELAPAIACRNPDSAACGAAE